MSRIPQPKQIVSARQANTVTTKVDQNQIHCNNQRVQPLKRQKYLKFINKNSFERCVENESMPPAKPTCLGEIAKINEENLKTTRSNAMLAFRQKGSKKTFGKARLQKSNEKKIVPRTIKHMNIDVNKTSSDCDERRKSWPSTSTVRLHSQPINQQQTLMPSLSARDINRLDNSDENCQLKDISSNRAEMYPFELNKLLDDMHIDVQQSNGSAEHIESPVSDASQVTYTTDRNSSNISLSSSSFDYSESENDERLDPMQCCIS